LLGIGYLIANSINKMTANKEGYQERFEEIKNSTLSMLDSFGMTETDLQESIDSIPIADIMIAVLVGLGAFVSDLLLVLLFSAYLLMEKRILFDQDGNQLDDPAHSRKMSTFARIDESVKDYINYKALISLATAVFGGTALMILGIDLAPVFALLIFCLNFVPNIGSIAATFLPLPILFFQTECGGWFPGPMWPYHGMLAILVPGFVQFIIGNFVEPIIFGDKFDMHAITVLVGLILWGSLWGIVGAILSVPILSFIMICLENFDHPASEFFLAFMRGRFTTKAKKVKKESSTSCCGGGKNKKNSKAIGPSM